MKPLNGNGPNPALKVAAGFLLLFLLSGILVSVAHGIRKIGFLPEKVSAHYLGSDEAMVYPKELPELMESTHVHLFMIPMVFYILCHLFAQTTLSKGWKITVIVLTFANIAGALVTPYLIRFVSSGFAWLVPFHDAVFVLSALLLTFAPLRSLFQNMGCGSGE